jgi:adenylate cyclase
MVDRDESGGAQLWASMVPRLTWAAIAANGLGGLLVFLLLEFLVPLGAGDHHDNLTLNGIAAVVYMPLALGVGSVWAKRRAAGVRQWLAEDRPPTAEERALVLAQPYRFVAISGFFWALAAVVFAAINLPHEGWAALIVGVALLLAGETTCAVGYLLIERIIRPITVLALAGSAPPDRSRPGVATRLTMAWSLGTGIPLLGILLVALSTLIEPDNDRTLLAAAIVLLAVVGMTVGWLAITFAARGVSEPIAAVRRAMARVEGGEYDAHVPVDDGSEVGLLEAGFNSMAAGLRERERMRDLFGRHVGREVAQAALERDGEVELGGELREVAVVFVDVIGSTNLALRRPPHEVVTLLNRFFSIVVEEIERQCGWVNKFEGDAALCVFGAPTARPDAAGDALRAARNLNERLVRELDGARAGIGVSAGPAVAGNVGTEERFEYTVIGDPVNEAARLCELAKRRSEAVLASDAVLASEAVLRRAEPDEAQRWELRDSVLLRGREQETRVAAPRQEGPVLRLASA